MKTLRGGSWLVLCLLAAGVVSFQPPPVAVSNFTYYVDAASAGTTDCTPGASGCTGSCAVPACGSQATPCHTIQAAVNIANCNIGSNAALEADVLVAAGTYPERIFVYPNIHVIGAGRDVTTIDAKGLNRSAVILAGGGALGFNRPREHFSISGVRIIHGSGDRLTLTDSGGNQYFNMAGGGVLLFGDVLTPGWPRVIDCRIEDNTLANSGLGAPDWNGAGIYVAQGQPVISGNLIQRNTTTPPDQSGQVEALGWGAGIFSLNFDCRPVITHNTIRNNVTVAQQGSGAGMYIAGDNGTVLSNNLIVGNSANLEGGGIYLYANSASAYNNVVIGNIGGGAGGGFSTGAPLSEVTITNNTIVGNVLTVHTVPKGATFSSIGGGIYSSFILSQQADPNSHLTNNLIAQNDATTLGGGAGLYSFNSFATNDHNDFFNDRPNEIRGDYTDAQVIGTNGNVSVNPVFTNAPTFWDHTSALGTSTTAIVFDSTRYAVGNRIEYNDDGVSRQITAINNTSKTLTFTPALAYKVCSNAINASCNVNGDCLSPGTCNTAVTQTNRILANWGSNTDVSENLRLTSSSPLRDAGTNAPLFGTTPTTDYDDLPRPTDGDLNGSSLNDIGAFEFRFGDSDGDGVPDSVDCSPLSNSAWALPDQVPSPLQINASQVLSWPRIPQSNVYNVYSGLIQNPFNYGAACFAAEVPGLSTSINLPPSPASGVGFYYLVGGVNGCGNGPIHLLPTVNPAPACAAQNHDTDGDTVLDLNDNCPALANPGQEDPEHDTVGTACDNCPALYNPAQTDVNANSLGDDCEDADGDTYVLTLDCNDNNPAIHPGAAEVCNGLDDNCANGVDEGADALCADSNSCDQDSCGGAAGCVHTPVADGSPCTDANACTQTDSCQTGVCLGANPVICPTADACHDPGVCDTGTGVCSAATPKPEGFPCEDGNNCTVGDSCLSGICQAGAARDGDSDTHPDPLCGGDDCNDANGLVWHVPAEVTNLTLSQASPANPTWDSQAVAAGSETTYDLVSGSLSTLSGISFPPATCLQSADPATSYSDGRPNPASGTGYWYLSRARNSCGVATYGSAARDAEIPNCP
ncbi:MAG TPA: putative metal-binding motif-containing protein [Candidatus Polarisedimenticolia bacterium]|jgi:hypothetical protein|nr:putative metal-binding motif-containing protein [Candidatus Polarisedimenticolia bacterium]